jgi:hypothetical protein
MSPSTVAEFLDSLRAMISELEAIPIPSVAVVDGFALGGGTELALGCDLRVGGESHIPLCQALSSTLLRQRPTNTHPRYLGGGTVVEEA